MRRTEKLPRETGREYALRIIKDNIICLELAPGSMVSEKELAKEMGLSRTPVREALIELGKVKIVEVYPQKGSAVALIDYALVEEARFMRSVLERAVVELLCSTAKPEDLMRLEEKIRLQEFYLKNPDRDRLMELDDEFHQALFEIAGKKQIYDLTRNMAIHFDRVRNMALTAVKDLKIAGDHQAILEAIRRRDAKEAGKLMEEHLSRYKVDEEAIRRQYDAAYFK